MRAAYGFARGRRVAGARARSGRLPETVLDLCHALPFTARAGCGVDYAVSWRLSGQRLGFVRRHLLDAVVLEDGERPPGN
ncbi:hypothetical protein ACQEV2_07225 [Streptomyces sp. CA-251387]|uniref:hypothetical protein n=1 Tax=Streptomyces sp. CA-251387 TaxID=3240064 RepID=UPI003D9295C4